MFLWSVSRFSRLIEREERVLEPLIYSQPFRSTGDPHLDSKLIPAKDEFSRFLKAAGCKLVVVEFSAKWCGPCKRIYPLVHAMSLQYQNVMFANVDVDDSKELAQTYHIRSVPTFQMFKQTQKRPCTAKSYHAIKKVFQRSLKMELFTVVKKQINTILPWCTPNRAFKKRNMGPDGNENEKSEKSSRGKSLSNILDSCKATALPGNPYSFSQRRWSFPPESPIRLKRFSGSVPPGINSSCNKTFCHQNLNGR